MDCQSEKNYISDLWATKPRAATVIVKANRPELYLLIGTLTGSSFSEKAWKWVNNSSGGICGHCRAPTKFLDFRRGFAAFCCKKCTANSKEVFAKKANTIMQRYGELHYSTTAEYKKKFTDSCLLKYGVTNPGQIESLKVARAKQKQLTFFTGLVDQIRDFAIPLFSFSEYTHVRDKELPWQCVSCGATFNSNIFGKLPKCPVCYPLNQFGGQSSIEKDILTEIRKFYTGVVIENSRQIIAPKELDLYFPSEKFAIEVNGVYWHSETRLDKNYHKEKFNRCTEAGIALLMITDYEWQTKRDLVCKMIRHRLGLTNRSIPARKCLIKPVSSVDAIYFFNNNHIHGYSKATGTIGLYAENSLVAAMSYMRGRFNKEENRIEIIRLAFSEHVVGALGKFVKWLQSTYPEVDIVTYSDLRYGTGKVYTNNTFVETHTTPPGYWYFVNGQLYHRLSWTKKKLVAMGHDASKTEQEIMQGIGALRIYDCGHKHFILRKNNE